MREIRREEIYIKNAATKLVCDKITGQHRLNKRKQIKFGDGRVGAVVDVRQRICHWQEKVVVGDGGLKEHTDGHNSPRILKQAYFEHRK